MTKVRGRIGLLAQRQKDYVTIRLRIPLGKLTAEQMEGISQIIEEYGDGYAIPTIRKSLEIPWVRFEDSNKVLKELRKMGLSAGSCGRKVRTIVACAGLGHCIHSHRNLEKMYYKLLGNYYMKDTPTKFKISLSGCHLACNHPYINDFGIIATEDGFSILVGGKGGRHPQFGKLIVEGVSEEEVFNILDKTLEYFRKYAQGRERIYEVIKRNGVDHFRGYVLEGVKAWPRDSKN
jgi:dissimilatory sulfite reductase (desulfoviridin) alpha/beta subunit